MNSQYEKWLNEPQLKKMIFNGVKKIIIESRMIGEHVKFSLSGRPNPSDAILLLGSGRSGTTWLQEVLATIPRTQYIFEPLQPYFHTRHLRHDPHDLSRLTGWDKSELGVDSYFSYYLRTDEENTEWYLYLEKLLRGQIRNWFTDYRRSSFFPDRYLIKMIRANMLVGYIAKNFNPKIIYIIRHPAAVFASRKSLPIAPWPNNIAPLLKQPNLITDYLEPWIDEIEAAQNSFEAHLIWWAIENRVALDQLANFPHCLVTYEALVLQPEIELNRIAQELNLSSFSPTSINMKKPSLMADRPYEKIAKRIDAWQNELSQEEIAAVNKWRNRFNIHIYNENSLPVTMQ